MAGSRPASHAGSWYSSDEETLSEQLDRWLDEVPDSSSCIGPLSSSSSAATFPTEKARVIIAPHAGYSYSGRAAAWAYRAADWSNAKRVFILGPSHHYYLTKCALSPFQAYNTPFGSLSLDLSTMASLRASGLFDQMSSSVDEAEHSIEMHVPYIHKMLLRTFSDYASKLPPIIPILVGVTSQQSERRYGELLAPYLADPANVFVVSSDFAHWGSRFRYTYYEPSSSVSTGTNDEATLEKNAYDLTSQDPPPSSPPIYESIARVDMRCIGACEDGSASKWWGVLERTENTVCGRHPIAVVLCGLEKLRMEGEAQAPSQDSWRCRFKFVRYERSSDCRRVTDSSVSYASAFAVV